MKKILKYSIDILPEEDGKGYYVVVPALPGCFSQGRTVEEAMEHVREAVALHIAELKRRGEPIPREGAGFQSVIEIAA
jgi:predicted RNase H-like HicB family nuclease